MTLARSRIDSEVDLDLEGQHEGYLRVPHSVHRSAYGWLPVPIVSFKRGAGPTVLLMAGNHGDEFEGQVALCKLCASLRLEAVSGQIIILPMANYPAAHAGRRTSPVDGGNLNRSFPGDPDGTPTAMIAHFIEELLLPRCNIMIDLHSGGSSLLYLPSVLLELEPDGNLLPEARELAEVFAAPYTQVHAIGREDRTSQAAAHRKGVLQFTTELAGAGTVSPEALAIAERGLVRVLDFVGVCKAAGEPDDPPQETRFVEVTGAHYCYSHEVGLFEPLAALGQTVSKGDPAGAIHTPETPWRAASIERFEADGIVVCKRIPGRVERGDCLFHLASDWE